MSGYKTHTDLLVYFVPSIQQHHHPWFNISTSPPLRKKFCQVTYTKIMSLHTDCQAQIKAAACLSYSYHFVIFVRTCHIIFSLECFAPAPQRISLNHKNTYHCFLLQASRSFYFLVRRPSRHWGGWPPYPSTHTAWFATCWPAQSCFPNLPCEMFSRHTMREGGMRLIR